jgi:cytochrome b-561
MEQMSTVGGRRRSPSPSGHHDPKRRRIYLALLAFSIFNALLGLSLILVWVFQYMPVTGVGVTSKEQLSNLHPVLMYTFMVSLNMYTVLIYRTHYDQPKQTVKWTHAILSGANILMSLLGVAAMYKAHLLGGLANFYSLHSWIGAMTNGFYLAQFLFGFVAFLKPGLTQQRRKRLMPWHRLAGTMLLVLAATAAITGITELVIFKHKEVYHTFGAITFIANIAGVSIVLMTATSVYLLTDRQYARPAV